MNIINRIKHKELGDIFCIADENGNPLEWAKIEKIKLLSNVYNEIKISFNLFCFDKNFKFNKNFDEVGLSVEKNIVKYYNMFLQDTDEIEAVYYKWYKENIDADESLDQMNNSVEIIEVRIFTNGYSIVINSSYNDELLAIEKVVFSEGEYDISMQMEEDIEVVEMYYE